MKNVFIAFSMVMISALLLFTSCKKHVTEPTEEKISATVSSQAVDPYYWTQRSQFGVDNDAYVNSTYSASYPCIIYFGDELLSNWMLMTNASNPVSNQPGAHWAINVKFYNGLAINRGVPYVGFHNAYDYLDSIKNYRTKAAGLDVSLTAHDLSHYASYGGNLWNTSPLQSKIKAFVWRAKRINPNWNVTLRSYTRSPWSAQYVTDANLNALNNSIKAWCDSSLTDRVFFINNNDPLGGGGFGGQFTGAFPNQQGYTNIRGLYWGTGYVAGNPPGVFTAAVVPPVAAVTNTSTSTIYVCRNSSSFTVNATPSYDPDGTIVEYKWSNGSANFNFATPNSPTCVVTGSWPILGVRTIKLELTDNHDNKTVKTYNVSFMTCP